MASDLQRPCSAITSLGTPACDAALAPPLLRECAEYFCGSYLQVRVQLNFASDDELLGVLN